jgi:protein-tyrosine phosphatase
MREIPPYRLWLGHLGDVRDSRGVLAAGIAALVDLALNEPPIAAPRELVYCRFPLVDGAGNPAWLLKAAIETTTGFLKRNVPTLVYCGAGMSRSPAVAAAAISLVSGRPPDACLAMVVQSGPGDVSPTLWREIKAVLDDLRHGFSLRYP